MDKIKKIVQIGAYDGETDEWSQDGQVYVYFEDESIAPVVLEHCDVYKAYESYGTQMGMPIETEEDLIRVVQAANEAGITNLCNKNDEAELAAVEEELEAAKAKAAEAGRAGDEPGVIPVHVSTETDVNQPEDHPTNDPTEDEDYSEELEEAVVAKNNNKNRIIAGVLAGAAALGAGFAIHQMVQNEKNQDVDNSQDNDIDFDTATFDELMAAMDDDDVRKVASQQAMDLVDTFHEATHKDGNFRLEEDGETYLDLSFEEALVLTAFSNYSEPEELYEIFGTYNITSTEAQDILESARTKMITYYMNAIEPSGLAEMFANEDDRAFFQNFESTVINFNAMHTTESSDQVLRDVYYNYILDGATNATNVGPMAKLLAFDTVYGGLNLTESASVEHTQFLEFHGMGKEAETRYYVENVLHLDYDALSDEDKATYRTNIIESETELVSLLASGETMTEDNSTSEELSQKTSITNLVDKMGLCNSVNSEIAEKVQALDTMEATQASSQGAQITVVNNAVSSALREAGHTALADKVDASLATVLSDELLSEIRAASGDAADVVENYENKMSAIKGENRPTMEQIINAANRQTALLENYAGSIKDVATLINNRRHVELTHTFEADENGYIGQDEDGIPIYDSSVLDDKTQEEIDKFIKENGVVIDEETTTIQEEVEYGELTEEEKQEVEEQKAVIEAEISIGNASENGKKGANAYANSSSYSFSPSTVTNPANGEVYDLNSMSFANGVAYAYAFGGTTISAEDSQIQNAAEVAAEEYANNFTAEQREAIANGLGTTWENAKEQIKDAYISGYTGQMKVEISTALAVGQEMKDVTEAALAEVEALNAQKQEENAQENASSDDAQPAPDEVTEEATNDNNGDQTITEGEEAVEDNSNSTLGDTTSPSEENNSGSETGSDDAQPAPDEEVSNEEYDPNIGEQFQEGEVLIEDAEGNKVNQGSETVEAEPTPASEVEVQTNASEPVLVEEQIANTEVVVQNSTDTPQDASSELSEDEIAALVEEVYQNTIAQEAAAAEAENEAQHSSPKKR